MAGRGVDPADQRMQAAIAALRAKLEPVDGLVAAGDIDGAMFLLASFTGHERARPEYVEVAGRHQSRVEQELQRRIAAKAYGRAYVLASLTNTVFEGTKPRVAELGRTWADELRPAIGRAEGERRAATALVLRAALAAATLDKAEAQAVVGAIDALVAERRLTVTLGAGVGARTRAAITDHRHFMVGGARSMEGLSLELGKASGATQVERGKESVSVQRGTRSVPNPARAEIEDRIRASEEEIEFRRNEIETENQSPSRSQSSIDTSNYQIEVAQGQLEDARQDLASTPATIEEPSFVDVPVDVETHTLTVSRTVTLVVAAPWAGELARQRETIAVERSDRATAGNRSLGVAADPVKLPAVSELEPDLDQATAVWLQNALDKVATRYVRELAVRDPKDGAALAIVLAPADAASTALEAERVPYAGRMIMALPEITKGTTSPFKPVMSRASRPGPEARSATPATSAPVGRLAPTSGPGRAVGQARPPTVTPSPRPDAPRQPSSPHDPLLAKAGYRWTIGPFDIKRGGQVVASVLANGSLVWKSPQPRVIAVFKPGGIVEDPSGKATLVVGAKGDVWMAGGRSSTGRLTARELSFAGGSTLTMDRTGRLTIMNQGKKMVSAAAVTPTRAPAQLVLLTGWLAAGAFSFQAQR